MKRTKKNLFSAAIVAIAVFMTVQTVAVKSSSQGNSAIAEPYAYSVKTAAKATDAVPVKVEKQTVNTNSKKIESAVSLNKQAKVNSVTTPIAALTEKSLASSGSGLKTAKAAAVSSEEKQILPGVLYDSTKKTLYGPDGKGLLYTGFEYNVDQKLFYSSINPWQKNFGYSKLYDDFAPLTNIMFETRIIYFNYGGLDWMIQIWKGIYGITSGAEVGIYNKDEASKSLTFNCANEKDYLLMNLDVFKDGQPFFSREEQMHWWLTGFVLGETVSPKDLTVKSTITFKDQEMTDAFVNALSTQSDTKDVYYSVDGLRVSLDW